MNSSNDEIMTEKLIGYGFLPANKVKILAVNQDRMNWLSLKKFGLKKVPVTINRIFQGDWDKFVDYKFYLTTLPITSLYYYSDNSNFLFKNERALDILTFDNLQKSIIIYENGIEKSNKKINHLNYEEYLKMLKNREKFHRPALKDKIDINDYRAKHIEALKAINNCYFQTYNSLEQLKNDDKKMVKIPTTRLMKKTSRNH